MTHYARLFQPIRLGSVEIKNRIVLPAHGTRMEGDRNLRYYEERLRNGIGLIIYGGIDTAGLTATKGHPAFLPDEKDGVPSTLTMAELSDEQKDAISHRGRAARGLLEWLAEGDRSG